MGSCVKERATRPSMRKPNRGWDKIHSMW